MHEIIKKCGTNCLIKSDEPHRIIGTVNDEVAAVISELQEAALSCANVVLKQNKITSNRRIE